MMIYRNGRYYDFWIPTTKKQLVDWLRDHKPRSATGTVIVWEKFSKGQLLAIYITYRIKLEDTSRKENNEKQLELF
jgi:hypothetical protein